MASCLYLVARHVGVPVSGVTVVTATRAVRADALMGWGWRVTVRDTPTGMNQTFTCAVYDDNTADVRRN